ncbi:MAG: hypothetical protein ABSG92_02600 [Conexivisphaerales archaeon]
MSQSVKGAEDVMTLTYGHSSRVITLIVEAPVPEFPGAFVLAAVGSPVMVAIFYERKSRNMTPRRQPSLQA